jgi:ribosome maturation protein SDO1
MVDIDKAVIARFHSGKTIFEVLIDCDSALDFKEGKDVPMSDVLAVEEVFSEARKGLKASEHELKAVFGTADPVEVAKQIIKKGEVQVTAQHKARIRERKRKQVIDIIRRHGIDPRTKLPHPLQRLELAFEEAKIKIDEHHSAEDQVERVLKELRPILPIRVEEMEIQIVIPSQFAGKAYAAVAGFGKLTKNQWMNDGSWLGVIRMPAGMQADLYDKLNQLTHGNVDTKIISEGE